MNALDMLDAILDAGFRVGFDKVTLPWGDEGVEIGVITKGGFTAYRKQALGELDAIESAHHWLTTSRKEGASQ